MSKNAKKVRIILVNNPTASLFMASWFFQNNYDKDNSWRNIAIYSVIDLDSSYSENIDAKKKDYEKINYSVFKDIVNEWYLCAPSAYDSYQFKFTNLIDVYRERKKRKNDINKIILLLKKSEINLNDVKEVWHCSNCFIYHFKYLCQNARFIAFEHGISDLRCTITNNIKNSNFISFNLYGFHQYNLYKIFNIKYFIHCFKKKFKQKYLLLNNWLEPKLVFFKKNFLDDEYVSVFGEDINKISFSKIETINSDMILKVADFVMKSNTDCSFWENLKGRSVLILLESIKPFSYKSDDLNYFFKNFEKHILDFWINLFNEKKIKNIIFKSRFFFEEQTREAFNNFYELKKYFNILFLTDYSQLNYSVEYYLSVIKPVMLLGAYSSRLFYSKKIFKDMEIYTYDSWYVEYCKKKFGKAHDDFKWFRPFFESDNLNILKNYVPKNLF